VARSLPAHVRPIKEKLQGLIIERQRPRCFAMRQVHGSELHMDAQSLKACHAPGVPGD